QKAWELIKEQRGLLTFPAPPVRRGVLTFDLSAEIQKAWELIKEQRGLLTFPAPPVRRGVLTFDLSA
ncbi:hypothetical protein CKJ90_33305, partial [Klebsiella pneumoniae]